jgi:anti-anti-sigma regulatory factor
MNHLLARLTHIKTDDPSVRLRGRTVIMISVGMAAVCLLLIIAAIIEGAGADSEAIMAGASALLIGTAFLARSGRASIAASLVIAISVLLNLALIAINSSTPTLPFFLVLATLLATALLPPARIWLVLIICTVGNTLVISLSSPDLHRSDLWFEVMINSNLLITAVAFIGYLSARSVRSAQAQAHAARAEAEAASQALAASNVDLEARVAERTSALRQLAAELQASLQAQQDLTRIVAEAAVPVIPISADTIVVPLVGNIDSARIGQTLAVVLGHIEHDHARTVILDVTGVAIIDTQVAAAILKLAGAARLMGAATVITGIRPEVAQSLVHLGIDLGDLRTTATLQESLAR